MKSNESRREGAKPKKNTGAKKERAKLQNKLS
jgi:hypothetical protein